MSATCMGILGAEFMSLCTNRFKIPQMACAWNCVSSTYRTETAETTSNAIFKLRFIKIVSVTTKRKEEF